MSKHQLGLADRQCRMSELSQRVQDAITILCTALYAARSQDEIVRAAADVLCQDLTRKLTGEPAADRYYRTVTKLGEAIADGEFKSDRRPARGRDPDAVQERLVSACNGSMLITEPTARESGPWVFSCLRHPGESVYL